MESRFGARNSWHAECSREVAKKFARSGIAQSNWFSADCQFRAVRRKVDAPVNSARLVKSRRKLEEPAGRGEVQTYAIAS